MEVKLTTCAGAGNPFAIGKSRTSDLKRGMDFSAFIDWQSICILLLQPYVFVTTSTRDKMSLIMSLISLYIILTSIKDTLSLILSLSLLFNSVFNPSINSYSFKKSFFNKSCYSSLSSFFC